MKYDLILNEMCNTQVTRYRDHITESFRIQGDTLEECFKKAYPHKRSIWYCSGYWVEFEDKEIDAKFREWCKTGVTMEMFYGNATVD